MAAAAPKPCSCDVCSAGIGKAEASLSRQSYGMALCHGCRSRANANRWQEILSRHAAGLEAFQPVGANPSGYGLWSVTVETEDGRRAFGGGWSVAQAHRNALVNARAGRFSETAASV